MHPRIRELADQALKECDAAKERGIDQYSKRFAELILQECAEIAKQTEGDDGVDYKSGRTWAGIDILKHFGVER
jgi:hypothetical protein